MPLPSGSIDWLTGIITVPQSYMTALGGGVYDLDMNQLRLDVLALLSDEEGIVFENAFVHNTEQIISGITFARGISFIAPYSFTFSPAGGWIVSASGANHNLQDLYNNLTGPTFLPNLSAGLIRTVVPSQPTETHIAAAYDNTVSTLRMTVWLERLGVTVAAPISCQVDWYEPDGTLLFTIADISPDPAGVFDVNRASTTLAANQAYYAKVTVTDAQGAVSTIRGVPTGP